MLLSSFQIWKQRFDAKGASAPWFLDDAHMAAAAVPGPCATMRAIRLRDTEAIYYARAHGKRLTRIKGTEVRDDLTPDEAAKDPGDRLFFDLWLEKNP